jgi:hypothetical protein
MRNTSWKLGLTMGLGLLMAGCSGPPPLPPPRVKEPASQTVSAAPEGILAPVDRWKRSLVEALPAPWRLEAIEAQITAPQEWTRLRGDRGLVLTFANGAERQSYWVMPAGFEGEAVDQSEAARERVRNDTFILFEPAYDAPGWGGGELVAHALGFAGK